MGLANSVRTPKPSDLASVSKTNLKGGFWGWLLIAAVIVLVDQVTKQYMENTLLYAERWSVLPFFDFTLLYNPGAAFSFLADGAGWQRWFFTLVAMVATTLIVYMLRKNSQQTLFCASLSLILGGAIGNVIDRIWHSHVIDFLLFYWRDWYFPAFNVADIAITCGAILLILDEFIRIRKNRHAKTLKK